MPTNKQTLPGPRRAERPLALISLNRSGAAIGGGGGRSDYFFMFQSGASSQAFFAFAPLCNYSYVALMCYCMFR